MIARQPTPEPLKVWPWEAEPGRLWSLLDMAEFKGAQIIRQLLDLDKARRDIDVTGSPSYASTLGAFRMAWTDLPLSSELIHDTEHLIRLAAQESRSLDVIKELADQIHGRFLSEYSKWGFYAVPAERKEYYEDPLRWFGQEIFANGLLAKAQRDAAEACRCYALGRWTASVFHCMRMLELGLQGLAAYLGVTLSYPLDMADWGKLLGEVDGKIESLKKNTPRSPARAEELEGLSRCAADLRYCKEIWRDNVCHARENYNLDEARDVLSRVKSLMADLAKKLKNA